MMLDLLRKYSPVFAAGDAPAPGAVEAPKVDVAPVVAAAAEPAAAAPVAAAPEPKAEPAAAAVKEPAIPAAPASLIAEAKLPAKGDVAAEPGAKDPKEVKAEPKAEAKPAPKDGKETAAKAEPKEPAKAGETPAADAAAGKPEAKTEVKAAEPPAPRTYEAFVAPDGIKLDDKQVSALTGILDSGELSHQQRAQELMNLHFNEIKRVNDQALAHQQDVWKTMQDRWKDDFRKDPQLGGNREETSLGLAKSVVEQFGGSPEQVAETLAMLSYTGAGNHVGLVRVLHAVGQLLSEGDFKPATPPSASPKGDRASRWYKPNGSAQGA